MAMQIRIFFETADPQSYAQGQKYFELSQQKFKELQELNEKFPTPEGTLFSQKYATLIGKYAESIASGFAVQEQAEKAIQGMIEGAANAQQMFGNLIATMGETQRGFLADGNVSAAVQYSHNLVQASVFLRQLESIQSELLLANRRHDTKAFAAQLDALTAIRREAQSIRANLLRQECRDMFDETQKALDGFTKQANEMIRLQLTQLIGQCPLGDMGNLVHQFTEPEGALPNQTFQNRRLVLAADHFKRYFHFTGYLYFSHVPLQ